MSEKQYSLVYYADKGGAFIKNNETGNEWYHDSRASLLEIVNELNELADENEQLEKENKELKEELNFYKNQCIDEDIKYLRENTVWEQMPTKTRTYTKTSIRDDLND